MSEMKDKAKHAKQKLAAAAKKTSDRLADQVAAQSRGLAQIAGKKTDAGGKRP
jgi:hypothetical protein